MTKSPARRIATACLITAVAAWAGGCTSQVVSASRRPFVSDESLVASAVPERLEESLFKDDQAVLSNDDLARILAAEVRLPARATLAAVRFGGVPYWWGWDEQFVRLNDQTDANFLGRLRASDRLGRVAYLPSLVTPRAMTLPLLRQSAARMQADLLLIYRTSNRNYDRTKWFKADQTRAYCTVEAILLDVRTGLVPFSTVINEQFEATKTKDDVDFSETVAKANQQAVGRAWLRLAEETAAYLATAPVKSDTPNDAPQTAPASAPTPTAATAINIAPTDAAPANIAPANAAPADAAPTASAPTDAARTNPAPANIAPADATPTDAASTKVVPPPPSAAPATP